ncbi:S41 family peptidase [Patescibacteria group bacterium]|nr:S41 family peptidase [Patescibacteria group bacterium]
MEKIPNKSPKFLYICLSLILLVVVFIIGYYYGVDYQNQIDSDSPVDKILELVNERIGNNQEVNIFNQVWQAINDRYVDGPVDQKAVVYGLISGLVNSLDDPNSTYFDPELAEIFNQQISGNFEGIGIEISIKDEVLTVISPLPGTPADQAGIKSGDKIAQIDGIDTSGLSLDFAVQLIRGEKGTEVTLTIIRQEEAPQEFVITRDVINVRSVNWEIKENADGNKVGYVEIIRFGDDTDSLFQEAINEILLESINGLIIDLRGNAGGYLETSINIASEFVENCVVLIEKDASGTESEFYDDNRQPKLENIYTVILVNGGSASASEILAGALRDNDKGVIVGTQTFGKGSVQDLEEYPDGSILKLTVFKWFTPSGLSIDDQGIEPDYLVEISEEDLANDLDPQLDKALELIADQ